MIVEYIRYRIPDNDRRAQFQDAYKTAETFLEASPNCLGYEISHCVEKPEHYIVRIEWDSLDGHLKGFRVSKEFQGFFERVKPFFNEIEEMQHYEVVTTTGTTQENR
jgi:quinol monooxygenase YgiN